MTPLVPATDTAIALYNAGIAGDTLAFQTLYAASTLDWKAAMSYYRAGVWDAAVTLHDRAGMQGGQDGGARVSDGEALATPPPSTVYQPLTKESDK